MQDLNDMRYFAEVVERGGFAAAGRALGIPKSRLSRRITDLEDRLGVRLLQRTTRKLSMTEAGELYLRHAAAVRDEAQAAEEALAHVQEEPRGTVRVTCPITIAQTTLAPLLPLFLARHPQVRIELEADNRVVDLVEEGVDVALRVRPTLEGSGSLVVKQLGRSQGLLLASPAQLESEGHPHRVEDLEKLSTVAMSAADGRANWKLLGPGGREFELQHRPRYTADDLLVLREAVVRGVGISVLPDYLCKLEMADRRLVEVLPGWAPPAAVLHAVFFSRRGMVPAVRRFLDFLGENVTTEALSASCPDP